MSSSDDSIWLNHCTCEAVKFDTATMTDSKTTQSTATAVHLSNIGAAHKLTTEDSVPPAKGYYQDYSVSDLYAQLYDGGFDYGNEFQGLQSARRGDGDAIGLAVGMIGQRRCSPFILDPADIDACFQLAPLVHPLGFQGPYSELHSSTIVLVFDCWLLCVCVYARACVCVCVW